MINNFIDNEKELLKLYLEANYLSPLTENNEFGIGRRRRLELIVRPECNQQCEYCYIYKYGKELYPMDTRVSNDKLIQNLHSLLHYIYIEKEIPIQMWELYAGDMFYDNLGFEILEIFYQYLSEFQHKHSHLMPPLGQHSDWVIIIPSNCSFVTDPDKAALWDEKVAQLKSINVHVHLSWSTDGLYLTDVREKKELNQEHFDTIMKFITDRGHGFHPMLSAVGIDNFIENYDWWLMMFEKYGIYEDMPSFLEVRNDDWTSEKIEKYKDVLDHMIKRRLEKCNNSLENFAYHLFNGDGANGTLHSTSNYDNLQLCYNHIISGDEDISCSIQDKLHINLANLEFPLCHRLSYPQFIGGGFKQDENGKIIDIIPKNVSMLITVSNLSVHYLPKCSHCPIKGFCLKGCLGSQYEASGELMQPAESVCNLFKARMHHLCQRYEEMGIWKIVFSDIKKYFNNSTEKVEAIKKYLIEQMGYRHYGTTE